MNRKFGPIYKGPELEHILSRYWGPWALDRARALLASEGKSAAVEYLRHRAVEGGHGWSGPNMPRVRTWYGFVEWFPPTWDVGTEPTYRISCKELARIKVEDLLPERQLTLFPVL